MLANWKCVNDADSLEGHTISHMVRVAGIIGEGVALQGDGVGLIWKKVECRFSNGRWRARDLRGGGQRRHRAQRKQNEFGEYACVPPNVRRDPVGR